MERYRRAVRGNTRKEDKVSFKVKIIRQSIVCSIILLLVFVIGLLKTDTARKLTERISSTLSYTVDYKSTVMDMVSKIKDMAKGE